MYYIRRKFLNQKIKKIYSLLFGVSNKITKETIEKQKEHRRFLISHTYLATKEERKKMISECIIQAFGFTSLQNYTQNTKFLIDIKKMTPYQELSFHKLKEISDTIKNNIYNTFNLPENHYFRHHWIFEEELIERTKMISYNIKNNSDPQSLKGLNSIISFYNYKTKSAIPEYSDIDFADGEINNELISVFIDKVFYYSNLSLLDNITKTSKEQSSLFSYKQILKEYKSNGGSKNINFIKKITNSFDISSIECDILSLNNQDFKIFINVLSRHERYDLVCLINELCKNPYNVFYFNFISTFKENFEYEKKYYCKNVENINKYKDILIEQYPFHGKI